MRRKRTSAKPTQHALLVVLGEFAQAIGLIKRMQAVTVRQQARKHSASRKVLEAFVATLAGLPHLQDLSHAGHPLDQDQAVAEAWGQSAWADYSGVSRTLQALALEEAQAFMAVLKQINQGFLEQEIALILEQQGYLIYDGDLTGLAVSKSSTTYPNAAYGHMDDAICLGYQAAVVSMGSPRYGRLWVSIDHHPGNALSSQQAVALVEAAEGSTGRRPMRRTDLLEQRLQASTKAGSVLQEQLTQHQTQLADAQQEQERTEQKCQALQTELDQLNHLYQAKQRPERPTSRLAILRKRVDNRPIHTTASKNKVVRLEQTVRHSQERLQVWQTAHQQLQERLERFQTENENNLAPVPAIFRLDAGFGTWSNVAVLIEMGYEVYTRAYSYQATQAMHAAYAQPENWQAVGVQAEMQIHRQVQPEGCCYPIDLGLERFGRQADEWKLSGLLHFGSDPSASDCQTWFDFYNRRQTIEAGIKENKNSFYLHHFKVRSEPAMILLEHFVLFAANFIRWASLWVEQNGTGSAKGDFDQRKMGTKHLIRNIAHTSAEVERSAEGCLLRFTPLSCLADKELLLPGHFSQPEIRSGKVYFLPKFERFVQ